MTPHDRDDASSVSGPLSDERAWELVVDYLTDQMEPEARASLELRAAHDEELRARLEDARRIWEGADAALSAPVGQERVERAWERLRRETAARPAGGRVISLQPRRRSPWPTALAASVVLALGIGVSWLALRGTGPDAAEVAAALRVLEAEPARLAEATLADGTRVRLAPGSRLVAPERFASDQRIVRLSGRAYFEVAHDADRPFVVVAGGAVTRVLGTEFDVRAFGGTATQVVVRSGRVAVHAAASTPDDARVLVRGDRGVVEPAGTIVVESGVDVDALTAWTSGRLVFRRSSLAEVAAELERWYDIRIELEDAALGERRLTAAFQGEPLPVVLQTLGQLVDARVEQDGRIVRFSPRKASAKPVLPSRNVPSADGGNTP